MKVQQINEKKVVPLKVKFKYRVTEKIAGCWNGTAITGETVHTQPE